MTYRQRWFAAKPYINFPPSCLTLILAGMTVNNNGLTSHSLLHHAGLERRRSGTQKKKSIHINLITHTHTHPGRCRRTPSTCLAVSAKLICVRRWVWDEFICAGWESSSHMLDLLGTWELYPYFPRGGGRCNPDRSVEALNGVEIGELYLWRPLRVRGTPAYTHTHAHIQGAGHRFVFLMWPTPPYVTWRYDSFLSSSRLQPARWESTWGETYCWRCRCEFKCDEEQSKWLAVFERKCVDFWRRRRKGRRRLVNINPF